MYQSTLFLLSILTVVFFFCFSSSQNKVVMAFGIIAMTGSVAYLAYLNAVKENQKDQMMYEQYFEDGSTIMRAKKSKWD